MGWRLCSRGACAVGGTEEEEGREVTGRVIPGEWTCTTCWATRCWPVKSTCYQCGTPRDGGTGGGQAGAGGVGAQAGVGTAMGRVIGPTGRNQVRAPGGDPTHRVNHVRNSWNRGHGWVLWVGVVVKGT